MRALQFAAAVGAVMLAAACGESRKDSTGSNGRGGETATGPAGASGTAGLVSVGSGGHAGAPPLDGGRSAGGAGGRSSEGGHDASGGAGTGAGVGGSVAGVSGSGVVAAGNGGNAGSGGMSTGGMPAVGGGAGSVVASAGAPPVLNPCDGKKCGEPCSFCPAGTRGCTTDPYPMFCTQTGTCSAGYFNCWNNDQPCTEQADCAVTTKPTCPDGSSKPVQYFCMSQKCFYEFPGCPGACGTDDQCSTTDLSCAECLYENWYACPYAHCDNGVCSTGKGACPSDGSCTKKSCGDECTPLCDADAGACTNAIGHCDSNLKCQVAETPLCGACNTDADCGAGHMCILQVGEPMPNQRHCAASDDPCGSADKCVCVQDEGACAWTGGPSGHCQCDNGMRLYPQSPP